MKILIMNPDRPKDKTSARALTKEQFDVVSEYIVECLNNGVKIKDTKVVGMLKAAERPIDFNSPR